jgi:DNA-binding CsgD family transcriptional regulator
MQRQTLRERDLRLLANLADGAGYQQSGAEMGVSINTVRSRIRALYEKLGVHSKSEAVARALREGWIR